MPTASMLRADAHRSRHVASAGTIRRAGRCTFPRSRPAMMRALGVSRVACTISIGEALPLALRMSPERPCPRLSSSAGVDGQMKRELRLPAAERRAAAESLARGWQYAHTAAHRVARRNRFAHLRSIHAQGLNSRPADEKSHSVSVPTTCLARLNSVPRFAACDATTFVSGLVLRPAESFPTTGRYCPLARR
jgi:hypothetical protein